MIRDTVVHIMTNALCQHFGSLHLSSSPSPVTILAGFFGGLIFKGDQIIQAKGPCGQAHLVLSAPRFPTLP